jgi:hypothetical protein
LGSKTLLIWAEQGLGDTLQFIRYADAVRERNAAARIVAAVQPEVMRLVATMAAIDAVTELHGPQPPFDVHCPLMSLPLRLGSRFATPALPIPYLRALPDLCEHWRSRMREAGLKRLKVGLVWAGGSRTHTRALILLDRRRSIGFAQLAPLLAIEDIDFFSLQKGAPAAQAQGSRLIDWTGEIHDFADTAALTEQLDLVISVDTSMVHLCGALGKPVWMFSCMDSCWRWGKRREDSPWYPRLRIFRQLEPMTWVPTIERMQRALHAWAEQMRGA